MNNIANAPSGGTNHAVQLIDQHANPALQHVDGACKGFTSMWMGLNRVRPANQASAVFGHQVNNNTQGILNMENALDQRANQAHTMFTHGGPQASAAFVAVQRAAGGNMSYQHSSPVQVTPGNPQATAQAVVNSMQGTDGFYRLGMSGPPPVPGQPNIAHVMGLVASPARNQYGRNQYGMMDPDTGEFRATSKQELEGMLARNMNAMGYTNIFNRMDLHHYERT